MTRQFRSYRLHSLDHMLEDHVVSNVSLVCATKLKGTGGCASSDHNRAATEVPASGEKASRIFCCDGVYPAVGNGDYRFGIGHPSVVLEYDPLRGDTHEPRAATFQIEDGLDFLTCQQP